jgi:alpha-beta hydrolase superfamily lysophospholipase
MVFWYDVNMNVEFVRFKASDGVELQGWLSKLSSDTAALHVHGMGGNGYENYFLDNLREMYGNRDITFFAIDTRGRGVVSDFRQADGWKHAGSCFEVFEESVYDIEGALDYLKSLGFKKFILQGHSLGCSKMVNYILSKEPSGIEKIVLVAPTDMVAWANADSDHEQNMFKAKAMLAEGRGEDLVGAQCWKLDKTPLSAQAYASKSDAGAPVDIYGTRSDGQAPIGKVKQPMLIPYGSEDIGITHPFGSMSAYKERLDKIKNTNTELAVIDGSPHSFRGYEDELTKTIDAFIGSSLTR